MRNIIVVDEKGVPIDSEHDIRFHPFMPRIGESVSMVRYLNGDHTVGRNYYEVVNRIDKYKVIDIEHVIHQDFNNSTEIDIKITVRLLSE